MSVKTAVKLTPEARKIVKQAIANIRAYPDQFDMDHWVGKNYAPRGIRTCGTSACLAGHIVLAAVGKRNIVNGDLVRESTIKKKLKSLVGDIPILENFAPGGFPQSNYAKVSSVASAILGHPETDADIPDPLHLFSAENWPEPFASQFFKLSDNAKYDNYGNLVNPKSLYRKRAALAVKRLRHYLKTGE